MKRTGAINGTGTRTMVLVGVRYGSKRLPGKALVEIAGQSALEHLIDRLKLASIPAGIIVCTSTNPENDLIAETALRKEVGCFRGSEENVMERFIQAADRENADNIVRVTGDDILIDWVHLDRAIDYHNRMNADYTWYGIPKGTETEIISTPALKRAYSLLNDPSHREHLTYAVKRPDLFRVCEMPVAEKYRKGYSFTLDTAEDLEVLKIIFHGLYDGRPFTLDELITFVERNPELKAKATRECRFS
ncbi:MAG: hypothetical protein AB1500_09935 [Bacillota bacterium]